LVEHRGREGGEVAVEESDVTRGSVSQVLDKLAAGSALAGGVTAATGIGAEIADFFGYGRLVTYTHWEWITIHLPLFSAV
jgi:hypothetical protein